MGIAERKERERQEMQDRIVEAAKRLFMENGFEKTSIRKIAEAIEYSPAAIYRYFESMDEIFYAVHAEIFDLLYDHMKDVLQVEHPLDRLRQLGERYLTFALENPEYYDLLFLHPSPMNSVHTEEEWHSVENTFGLVFNTVDECVKAGCFPGKDVHSTTFIMWASIHGMVTLRMRCRMKMYPEEVQIPLMRQSINQLLDSMTQ
ncbi:MAG: TetR/AcrR family transcriptional regulator [Bacteroidota bacterium]